MKIEKITSKQQYRDYLKRVNTLIVSETLTDEEFKELLALVNALEECEAEHYPV